MLKKKLTSLILALSMIVTSTVAFTVNAEVYYGEVTSADLLKDCINLEEEYYEWTSFFRRESHFLFAGTDERGLKLYSVHRSHDCIKFSLPGDSDIDETLSRLTDIEGISVSQSYRREDNIGFEIYSRDENGIFNEYMSQSTANEIFDRIGKDSTSYKFIFNKYTYSMIRVFGLHYAYSDASKQEADKNMLNDFFKEENINVQAVDKYDRADGTTLQIVSEEELTAREYLDIIDIIFKKTGEGPFVVQLDSGEYSGELNIGGTIDMKNAIKGDANDDSEVSIADATAILQAIGNPDKYALSLQGEYNADVYGDHDGITPMDAIMIQQYDAHIIDSLE